VYIGIEYRYKIGASIGIGIGICMCALEHMYRWVYGTDLMECKVLRVYGHRLLCIECPYSGVVWV
jgi:hypothetical protein